MFIFLSNCRSLNWKNNWHCFGKYVCVPSGDRGDFLLQKKVRQEATASQQEEKMVSKMCSF